MKELAAAEIDSAQEAQARIEAELQTALLPRDPQRRSQPVPRNPRRNRRRRSRPVCRRPAAHVYPLRRAPGLARRDHLGQRFRTGRLQGSHRPHRRCRRLPKFKFESGGHRVQRVPATETQGRIHTSACTVAVMPEADEVGDVELNPADLRIDTFRASGAGGQHINKTDSAVRITHLPTGIVAECQDGRSQHQNKASALRVLAARIRTSRCASSRPRRPPPARAWSAAATARAHPHLQFPQGRLTDHRINLTIYKLDAVMQGDLDEVVAALTAEHQAELLARWPTKMAELPATVGDALAAGPWTHPGGRSTALPAESSAWRRPDRGVSRSGRCRPNRPGHVCCWRAAARRRAGGLPARRAGVLRAPLWRPGGADPAAGNRTHRRSGAGACRRARTGDPRSRNRQRRLAVTLALKSRRPRSRPWIFSPAALEVARANAGPGARCASSSDWFAALDEAERFGLHRQQSPYIADGDPHLAEGDVRFELATALSSGPAGSTICMRIAAAAPGFLNLVAGCC